MADEVNGTEAFTREELQHLAAGMTAAEFMVGKDVPPLTIELRDKLASLIAERDEAANTVHHSIVLGTRGRATKPYQFVVGNGDGLQLSTILTPVEYLVLWEIANRMQLCHNDAQGTPVDNFSSQSEQAARLMEKNARFVQERNKK
jgi:hypothetical protein